MTQPDDAWLVKMGELLKEHQRALTMRDAWERKRAAAAARIDAFRSGATIDEAQSETEQEQPAQA